MGFLTSPARRLHQLRAGAMFVLAVFSFGFWFAPGVDSFGRGACIGMGAIFIAFGIFNVWQARRTPASAQLTMIPSMTSAPEQLRFYIKMRRMTSWAFPILTGWVAYDLYQLENGGVNSVSIWAPLVPIYERFGFSATILLLAGVGVACFVFYSRKIRQLSAERVV